MPSRGAVAGLAVNPGLRPGSVVAVALQIVVLGKLADVAPEARGIESQRPVLPVKRLVPAVAEMAHRARRGVKPFPAADIVRNGQHLEPAPFKRRKEIINVLAAHHLHHGIALLTLRSAFEDDRFAEIGEEPILARDDFRLLREEIGSGQFGRVRLHGQAVERGGPQLVELLMAFPAALRPGKAWSGYLDRGIGGGSGLDLPPGSPAKSHD